MLLGRRLNEGVREVLSRTHCYVKSASISISANDFEYELKDALTDDPLAILNVITSDTKPCERISPEELHEYRRASPAMSSAYTFFYAVDGANLLLLYPTPQAASTLTVYYVAKPTEMSSAAHDPSDVTYGNIPVQWHDAIEYWALFRMAGYDDDASSQMGMAYRGLFDNRIREIRRELRNLGGRKLSRARVGRRAITSSDPSRT